MIVNASSGSPIIRPQLYRTASISTISQAEQQDRFLQLGELNELAVFLKSGSKRLEIADLLAKNANILVAKAADKIFVGGSAISYLEKPQASFASIDSSNNAMTSQQLLGDTQGGFFDNISSSFNSNDSLPPGFKPINVVRYGSVRMKKSLRDLDWFLRYLTYSIIAGDPNILSVNIRGLKDLISNACSSAAAIVALREMRKVALGIFVNDLEGQKIVQDYFNVLISEFEAPSLSDKLRKTFSVDTQGLRLPQIYSNAGVSLQKFVMKTSLSAEEKKITIKACYRQIFERDIDKAYNLKFSDLESQVKNGQLSIKEFIRFLGKSSVYRKQFYESFVNSRVVELAFRHFLGRGLSSKEEFQKYFGILSLRGLDGLIDALLNSIEYADYFGEETVPYLRILGEEPQECRNWGIQRDLFNYSTPFRKIPQFITLFTDYCNALPDQHPYGLSNDPLLIQFGAIFPNNLVNLRKKSSFFTKDTRRILLKCGPSIDSQISRPASRPKIPGSLGPKVFQLNQFLTIDKESESNVEQVIKAAYLRIFGRFVYQEELLAIEKIESRLRSSSISVKDFVRLLVKTSIFRSIYWEPLYICKAIEYIHSRLLGRPTYGRQEINQYFNIVYKHGYYSMIDSMIDSIEYSECFGNNVVPYERYVTSSSILSRKLNNQQKLIDFNQLSNFNNSMKNITTMIKETDQGTIVSSSIKKMIMQGVTSRRDQVKIFTANSSSISLDRLTIVRAIYRQLFERDLNSFTIGDEFYYLEKAFISGDINVQQMVEKLGLSVLYRREFYQSYPNTKVIELGTKHFLGRAPNNQAEIRYYNQILASQGQAYFISALVNSVEYKAIFGSNTVPYRRFPTLPAANFPNTERLYNTLTKQNDNITIPSFQSILGNQ
uniref:Phycobiliprotein ApcE n=1 Tax=Spyridia filamentosa TaxID=196632 RepID=A0A1Z1MJI5_SPYFI|nr:phycobilisome linker polypeptide [Spyridia filamentosa]ARW66218.1 phycobilisome linker polypeptide [Spyridia filamentosa]